MSSLVKSTSSHHHSDAPPTSSLSHSSSARPHHPADSHHHHHHQPESQQQPQQQQQQQAPTRTPLERAKLVIDDRLTRDDSTHPVGDSLTGASSGDYVLPPNHAWQPVTKTRTVLLPDRLFEEHDRELFRSS